MKLPLISLSSALSALALLSLSSCDDTPGVESSRPNVDPSPVKPAVTDYYVSPSSSGCIMEVEKFSASGAEAFIGHGYDVTKSYLDPSSARTSVIDLYKMPADKVSDFDAPATNDGNSFQGADANEFLGNLMANMGVKPQGIYYFAGTLGNASSNSGFLMQIQWRRNRVMAIDASSLSNYLSSDFSSDLSRLTAEGLVEKYGTHIITRAVTGLGVRYIYSAFIPVSGSTYSSSLTDGYDAAKAAINGSLNASLPEKLAALYNYGARLNISFLGGDTAAISFDESKGLLTGIQDWFNTAGYSNSALIELGDNDIVPLSAAISDAGLASQVDRAITIYVEKSRSNPVELIPLFQNTNGKQYRYVTSALESSTLDKSGIYSYGVLGALSAKPTETATKPLYTKIDEDGNQILSLIQPSSDWQRIGYVLADRTDQSVSLYEITDGTLYAYTIEAANSLGSKRQWHPTGVVFHLLRP